MARNRHARGDRAAAMAVPGVPPAGTVVTPTYPQTTRGQGQTFAELSRKASRTGYQYGLGTSGWGQTIDQPLPASPGYTRHWELTVFATGGSASANVSLATTPAGVDAGVYAGAIINNLLVRDAAGNTIFNTTDLLAPYLIDMFSGQAGVLQAADLKNWPSYSAIATGSATAGNTLFHLQIPLEVAPGGLGVLATGAANLQPTIHLGIQPAASVFTAAPGTLPSITVQVDENYWVAAPGAEPPDLGTVQQWQQLTANPTVVSGASTKIQLGKTDGYITTLILIFRDSTGARTDYMLPGGIQSSTTSPFANPGSAGKRLRLWIDSVLVADEDINQVTDRMYNAFPGLTVASNRVGPTGVVVYTFRNSITRAILGVDDGALWLPATPGTTIEVEGVSWGTFTSSPGTITALIGSIVPGQGGVPQGIGNVIV